MHKNHLDEVEKYFDTTEDGEASEKAEGASKKAKLIFETVLHVAFYLVVGRRVKEDVKDVQLTITLSTN